MNRCFTPSLSSFLQMLWIIPERVVRWVLMMFSLCLSGSVLVMTFWPAVRDDNRRIALATVGTIILLHALLSVGCLVRCCLDLALVTCYGAGKEVLAGCWKIFLKKERNSTSENSKVEVPIISNMATIAPNLTAPVTNSIIKVFSAKSLTEQSNSSGIHHSISSIQS